MEVFMIVEFTNKVGDKVSGEAVSRGWFVVDEPESYEIKIDGKPNHAFIPVDLCEVV